MNNTFCVIKSPNDIQHYGVLGMKWGVRRYQNIDGSYTQKGLKRLNQTKQIYEEAKANRNNDNNSRLLYKKAKRQYKADKRQLKRDYRADKGRELYAEGKTISNNYGTTLAASALITGGLYATKLAFAGAKREALIRKMNGVSKAATKGNRYLRTMLGVGLGATALGEGLLIKKSSDARKLRSYYGHKRNADMLKDERAKRFGTPSTKDEKNKYIVINGRKYKATSDNKSAAQANKRIYSNGLY